MSRLEHAARRRVQSRAAMVALAKYGRLTPPPDEVDSPNMEKCVDILGTSLLAVKREVEDLRRGGEAMDDRIHTVETHSKSLAEDMENLADGHTSTQETGGRSISSNRERFDMVDIKLDEVYKEIDETRGDLLSEIDNLKGELTAEIEDLKSDIREIRSEIREIRSEIDGMKKRAHNSLATRPFMPVYSNMSDPAQLPRNVGYYWNLHKPENYTKLVAEHRLHGLNHRVWTETDDDHSDDDLDLPPSSLEQAVSQYPGRAIQVLFLELGLDYRKVEEEMQKLEEYRRRSPSQRAKREQEGDGGGDRRIKGPRRLGIRSKPGSEKDSMDATTISPSISVDLLRFPADT